MITVSLLSNFSKGSQYLQALFRCLLKADESYTSSFQGLSGNSLAYLDHTFAQVLSIRLYSFGLVSRSYGHSRLQRYILCFSLPLETLILEHGHQLPPSNQI